MGPKKITNANSSSDIKQLAQILEHEEEDPVEDLLENSPSPPEPLIFPSQSLALSTVADVAATRPNPSDPVLQHQMARTQLEPGFLRYPAVAAFHTTHDDPHP
ncbi:hypothetical protein ACLOJK_013566 [Asimina triloba]